MEIERWGTSGQWTRQSKGVSEGRKAGVFAVEAGVDYRGRD